MKNRISFVAMFVGSMLLSCVPAERPVDAPNPYAGKKQGASQSTQQSKPLNVASGSIPLDEKAIRTYTSARAALSYQFSYLDVSKNGTLEFKDGKAKLDFTGLAVEKTGEMKLEIVEGAEVKLRGVIPNLVLKPSNNALEMTLNAVVGGSTNATITIVLPGGIVPTPATTPTPGATQSPTPIGDIGGFEKSVKPIFLASCSECHHAGTSLDLTKFPFGNRDQKAFVDVILASVQSTTRPMPLAPRPRLKAEEIDAISKWKNGGLKP